MVVAGAVPNLAHLAAYCRNRTDDPKACDAVPADSSSSGTVMGKPADVLPLKAIVLMEPFLALFDKDGLKSVEMPALLYRAQQSDLAAEGTIFALAAGLPRAPQQETTTGGHCVRVVCRVIGSGIIAPRRSNSAHFSSTVARHYRAKPRARGLASPAKACGVTPGCIPCRYEPAPRSPGPPERTTASGDGRSPASPGNVFVSIASFRQEVRR